MAVFGCTNRPITGRVSSEAPRTIDALVAGIIGWVADGPEPVRAVGSEPLG
ncbi:hypothetical protein ABIB27_002199 [Arthrobacter sp. UYEF21]